MVAVDLIEEWRSKTTSIPHWLMWAAGVAGICVSQWKAYRSLLNLRSDRIRELTALFEEGRAIRSRYIASMTGSNVPRWEQDRQDWRNRVRNFLVEHTSPLASAKFSHDTGLPDSVGFAPYDAPHPWFDRDLNNLMEIIERVDYYS